MSPTHTASPTGAASPTHTAICSVTERRAALASFGAVGLLIVIFLLRDASAFVNSPNDELIGHVGASAGFSVAATGTLLVLRGRRPPLLTILLAGTAITIAGELAQGLVPSRGIEMRDILMGLGGVLVAAVGIEVVLERCRPLLALRLHFAAASIASAVLLAMLLFDLAPRNIDGAVPDGDTCPLTTLAGTGEQIIIGADPPIVDTCLQTAAGGFGLFGPEGSSSLDADAVLVSSPLGDLFDAVIDDRRLVVRAEIVTEDFGDEITPPGAVFALRSADAGELLQLRTRGHSVQVFGPSIVDPYRSVNFSPSLSPSTRHDIEIELTATEMHTFVDGRLVAIATVDPAWLDELEASDAAEDLTLYIANSPGRTLGFDGVIEWIEIDS